MSTAPGKRKLLDDSDSDSEDGGAQIKDTSFKVNEEYARRFEHNKKREELHRLEEKYKKDAARKDNEDDESSSDEEEDEEGFLATEDLDAQISATLQAIRNKDPRVYDKEVTFYQEGETDSKSGPKEKKEKPVYLKDYHREKFMRGDVGASDDEDDKNVPMSYAQEQETLKKSIVSEMHAANADDDSDSDSDSDDDDFIKRKEPAKADENGVHPSRAPAIKKKDINVEHADRDPETFLSNFMSARAWLPEEGSRWEAFESDDEKDDDRADEFEQAYNLRFEDPAKSNEVLKTYARDVTAARSVRREEKTGRKKRRETEREEKEEEKRERKEDKARLRKLKLDQAEQKLKKVKQAAGAVGAELKDEDWMKFLNDAWENDKWEEEMNRRFGDDYYAMKDPDALDSDQEDEDKKSKHPKKPKWDDDIDIKDIVPDFDDEEGKPEVTLSDNEETREDGDEEDDDDESAPASKKRKKAKDHKRAKQEAQREARKERTKLEALVDSKMELTNHDLFSSSSYAPFRYRETSPQSFGMTARDILLAPSDSALNDFAGLKKLATFRDEEKKRRDRKRLNKKARLREWRRDTFGRDYERTGPTYGFEKFASEAEAAGEARVVEAEEPKPKSDSNVVGEVGGSRKKRKRSKGKKKGEGEAAEVEA